MSRQGRPVIKDWCKLVVHEKGGWALPGGGRTEELIEAQQLARKLAEIIGPDYKAPRLKNIRRGS